MSEPGDGSWAKLRGPVPPPPPVAGRVPHPPDRVALARRRGEAMLDDWSGLIALIIAVGYGAFFYVGILSTWIKWPALAVVLLVLWRNRPRRRRRRHGADRTHPLASP